MWSATIAKFNLIGAIMNVPKLFSRKRTMTLSHGKDDAATTGKADRFKKLITLNQMVYYHLIV